MCAALYWLVGLPVLSSVSGFRGGRVGSNGLGRRRAPKGGAALSPAPLLWGRRQGSHGASQELYVRDSRGPTSKVRGNVCP